MAALITVGGLDVATVAPATASATVSLAGSQPAFLGQARDLGATPASRPVDFEVLLGLPRMSSLQSEITALSTPGSPSFRRFLTPSQFRARYSPTAGAVAAVESWVRGGGLTVSAVAPSRLYVEVKGTMGRAEALVGTTFRDYSYHRLDLAEPVGNYVIPATLGATVAGIVNLDDSAMLQKPDNTLPGPPRGVREGIQPCSAYYGEKMATDKPMAYGQTWPYTSCGDDADQYEQAFGLYDDIQAGTDGTGVTVAVVDAYASPTIVADADTWSTQNNLAPFASGQFTQTVPAADGYGHIRKCGAPIWYTEETLDVESVHAMAPGAAVDYVGSKNCGGGLTTAWASVIDNHLAPVVTDSWTNTGEGEPASSIAFFHEYLMEAASTGMTVMFASGDDGDEVVLTGHRQVDSPVDDPYATAVGGTSTEIGADGSIVFQAGWSNSYSRMSRAGAWTPDPPGTYSSGSGGGTSVLFDQPSYQAGVVPDSISESNGSTPMRAVPDVAMPGDPNTGLVMGETQHFRDGTYYATFREGGTSLSSPLFAGVVADAVQNNGAAVGFINPVLYADIGTSAITDVTAPASTEATVRTDLVYPEHPNSPIQYLLQTIDVPTTIAAGPGYDDQTGVGTPNGTAFLDALTG